MAVRHRSILDLLLEILPTFEKILPASSKLLKELSAAANVTRIVRAWEYVMKMKCMIMAKNSVEKIQEAIPNDPNEPWINKYLVQNPILIKTDPQAACCKLSDCFEAEYRSLSIQMIGNALVSFIQSVKAWKALYDFKILLRNSTIPFYERQREQVRVYIERCAGVLNPLLLLEHLNPSQIEQLERARGWLDDAKNVLDSIHQDCENKIREAQNHRSTNGLSGAVNLVAFIIEFLSFRKMMSTILEWRLPDVSAAISTSTLGVTALGDICATYSADQLVEELQTQLNLISQLETERNTLATRLSTMNR